MLRNLPADTARYEIIKAIVPHLSGGWFKPGGELMELKFLAMFDRQTKVTEYHAVAKILPDKVAVRVIKGMHAKKFKGKHIAVREYVTRRRNLDHQHERRRDLVIQEVIDPIYTAREEFHRVVTTGC